MEMRPSRVLDRMRAGDTVCCAKINLSDPRSVEIAARAGYDCVWLCMEHVPTTLEQAENQVRTAKMYNVDTLVRVQRGSYSDMIYPLEMDASGILVPHVMSAEEARQIARTTRFYPVGRRPVDGGNADGAYCAIPLAEYMQQANERRFVGIQIEDPEALDELDDIAAVEGIDMLFFGPGDFSQGVGVPGQIDHPKVVEARKRVLDAAQKHGKFAGTTSGNPEQFIERAEMGFQFVSLGADVVALVQYFGDLVAGVRGQDATKAGNIYQSARNDY